MTHPPQQRCYGGWKRSGSRNKSTLSVQPKTVGPVTLDVTAAESKVELYATQTSPSPLGNHLEYETAAQMPTQLWVQGTAASDGLHDVVLRLDAAPAGQHFTDTVKFTVVGLGHIQCEGQNLDGTTIVLLKGTIYPFTAIPQPAGAGWPGGLPAWSGLASGTGEQKQVTFDFSGNGYTLTAQYGNSKTVTIDVIVPEIDSVEITGSNHEPICDVPFSGWKRARTGRPGLNEPGCYKQGAPSEIRVLFWHAKTLTFPTNVYVRGDVDSNSDDELMGSDLPGVAGTFGTSWDNSPITLVSWDPIPAKVQLDSYVDIDFYYSVPSGTNTWIDADDCGWLTVYVIWDSPKNGSPNSTAGAEAWAAEHFTKAHLADACEWGGGGSSPADIADKVCDSIHRGWLYDSPQYTVANMWGIHDTNHGQCDQPALEMCYVMRCLGLAHNLAFANLAGAINHSKANINGEGWCNTHAKAITKIGDSFWTSNNWQGCAYEAGADPLRDTICWDTQHNEHGKKYWELGNDKSNPSDAPDGRYGILYDYHWRNDPVGGTLQQVITGDEHTSCSKTVYCEHHGN